MGRWQTPKAADGGALDAGVDTPPSPLRGATSPDVLRKSGEDLVQRQLPSHIQN